MSGGAHRAGRAGRAGPLPGAARTRLTRAALASVAAVLLLLGAQGTFAFWSDRATVTGGPITSGSLDLTVDGSQGAPSYAKTGLTLNGMLPGESVAETVVVRNVGSAPFRWTATVTPGGDLGPALDVQLYLGSATTGDDTTYPRTEGCATTTTPVVSGTTATRLDPGAVGTAGQTLCIRVALPSSVGDAYQARTSGSVSVRLDATQALP
ncbi:MAG: SipW-dependent-type signal peptide-containing protein [Nocardioides alkalitolerans]